MHCNSHPSVIVCVILLACGSSHGPDDAASDTPSDVPALDVGIDSTGCDPLGDAVSGTWTQVMRVECGSGTTVPDTGIQELVLDGRRIEVTWTPFETYVDWWGSYATSPEGGIRIDVEGGNYVPDDIDPEGCISVDGADRLVLTDVFLGSPVEGEALGCGHVFTRR